MKKIFNTYGDLVLDIFTEDNLQESSFIILTYLAKYTEDPQARFTSLAAARDKIFNALKNVKIGKNTKIPTEWIRNLLAVYGDAQVKKIINLAIYEKRICPCQFKGVLKDLENKQDGENYKYPQCVKYLQSKVR